MSKRNDDYIDYRGSSYSPAGRRKKNGGFIICVILLVLLALGSGFTAFYLSQKNIGEKPTPDELGQFVDQGRHDPTPVPTDPVPTATATPTATLTPTPFIEPGFNDPYLAGFDDFRDPLKNIAATGYDTSKLLNGNLEFEPKGVYMGNSGTDSSLMDNVEWIAGFTELNAVMVNVKDDFGRITYYMDCDAAKEADMRLRVGDSGSIGDIKSFLDTMHSQGIYVIARICCFRESNKSYFPLLEKHPDWFLKKKNGELYRDNDSFAWLNPYNEEACKYIADIAAQAVEDGFDEICFDYVRISSYYSASIDFGAEGENTNICDQIAKVARYFCNRIKPLGAYTSGCVYGMSIHMGDRDTVGQNYTELAKYFDYICPMVYPSHYSDGFAGFDNPNEYPFELVKYEINTSNRKLEELAESWTGHIAKCRPWLQCFSFGTADEAYIKVRHEISGCNEADCYTWILWNSSARYEQDYFLTSEEEYAQNTAREY